MSARDDGGPAFAPNGAPHPTDPTKAVYGMTLRDYFAAHIAAGMISGSLAAKLTMHSDDAVRLAYGYADAMIAERAK